MIEEHLFGQRVPLALSQKRQDLVLRASQVHRASCDLSLLSPRFDRQIAALKDGFGLIRRAADDGLHTGDEFVLVKRLGEVIIGAIAEASDLVLDTV